MKLLASEAAVQLVHLERLGLLPAVDELVLEFDDIACARDDMFQSGELSADEHQAVAMLDATLDEMFLPEDKELWTPKAVEIDERWAKVRCQAIKCLRELRSEGREDD